MNAQAEGDAGQGASRSATNQDGTSSKEAKRTLEWEWDNSSDEDSEDYESTYDRLEAEEKLENDIAYQDSDDEDSVFTASEDEGLPTTSLGDPRSVVVSGAHVSGSI